MKQVLQDRNGATHVRDVPSPACPNAGVLVRTSFSAISSGTERARVEVSQKSLIGKARERPDLVRQVVDKARTEGIRATRSAVQQQLSTETAIGYSSSGVVVEVGPAAGGLEVGDRVSCCGGGHANHAELCAMPRNLVAKVPDGVSMATAAIATIGAIALHGVRLSGATLGERVGVVGCGLVGQIACRLLRAQGAIVFALDVDQRRVDVAVEHGADYGLLSNDAAAPSIAALTGSRGLDRVLVTAASKSAAPLQLAAEIARDRGTVILVGAVPIEFPRAPLYNKELEFRVSRSYGPGRYDNEYEERGLDYPAGYVRWTEQRNLEAILDLQARGLLDLSDLVDDVVPAEQAEAAYGRLVDEDHSRRPLGAIVLSYGPDDDRGSAPSLVLGRAVAGRAVVPTAGNVRIGLVGPGGFASRVLLPALAETSALLEVVGGGSGPSAEAATRRHGFARFAESDVAVCTDGAVDAVVIGTRHGAHARLTSTALRAGKHVFCEKPLALSVADLDDVLSAAETAERVLAVGFNRRFAPMVRATREHIAAVQGPITATFRVNAGQIAPDHWVHDLEQGGGRLLGEGCHFVDTLRYVVGQPIVQVYAAAHGGVDVPLQARDCALITLTFADGSVGQLAYVSQGSGRVPKERLEVFGNGGRSAVLDDYKRLELYTGSTVDRQTAKSQDKGHRAEVAAFVSAARGQGGAVPLSEIANVSYATLAIVRSLETGAVVQLADVTEPVGEGA